MPRTRSGQFQTQVLKRYQRREPVINEALKQVFLLGVSTRQAGRALATLVEDAVSASTVSAVAKALDQSVHAFHRRRLPDHYRYLLLDGVSVRIRLVGKVQRRMVLCAYGVTTEGKRELIDFHIVNAEGQESWFDFLWGLFNRGLHGEFLELIGTDGQAGLAKAIDRLCRQCRISAVGPTSCATWRTNSKPLKRPAWRRPSSFTKPRPARRPSNGFVSGAVAGKHGLPRPWPASKPIWRNCWLSLVAQRPNGNAYAPPMSSSASL